MSEITMQDVIAASYSDMEAGMVPVYPAPTKATTALLLIDIQQLATPEYMAQKAIKAGLDAGKVETAVADYKKRFYAAVDQCAKLLAAARQHGITPIHVKISAMTPDARDTSVVHKMLNWKFPPQSEAAQFLPQAAPAEGEIVLTKTVSGSFTGTNLDRILRHMGIQYLTICGFVTDECVETTFRDAIDHGYLSSVARDATTTYFEEAHAFFVGKWGAFGLIPSTDEVLQMFAALPES